jgi:hypothetical protein
MLIKLNHTTKSIFFILLFSPLLAYAYSEWFRLPKTFNVLMVFVLFIYGVLFFVNVKSLYIPVFAKYIMLFAIYRSVWLLLLDTDRHIYTQTYHHILFFSIFFTLIMIYNGSYTEKFIKNSVLVMKITVILAAVASIIQVFDFSFLDARHVYTDKIPEYAEIENLYSYRRPSVFGYIEQAALGLAFIPLLSALVGYLLVKKDKNYIIFLLLGGIVAFLSNTRFVMVGYLIISLQALVFHKVRFMGYVKYVVVVGISTVFFYYSLQYLGYDFSQWYEERLLSEGSIEKTTRYKAIDNFLKFFPQNPVFGTGELTEEVREASRAVGSSHIHVGYLSHLVYYGIIGCFFLFGAWFFILKRFYKTAKHSNYWGSFFAFLMFLWSFATMSQPSIFYYGLIFAFIFDKYFRDNSYNPKQQKDLVDKKMVQK